MLARYESEREAVDRDTALAFFVLGIGCRADFVDSVIDERSDHSQDLLRNGSD